MWALNSSFHFIQFLYLVLSHYFSHRCNIIVYSNICNEKTTAKIHIKKRSQKRWWHPKGAQSSIEFSQLRQASHMLANIPVNIMRLSLAVSGWKRPKSVLLHAKFQRCQSLSTLPLKPCWVWSNSSCQWNKTDSVFHHCMHGEVFLQHCSLGFFSVQRWIGGWTSWTYSTCQKYSFWYKVNEKFFVLITILGLCLTIVEVCHVTG